MTGHRMGLFCGGISLKKSRRSQCSRSESWFIRCCSASCTVRRGLSPFQCHSGEATHLYLPLLSTILHEKVTASPSLKYANLMHLWCRSACFNLFWDLNPCVFYYMVQQTPFKSWTSILVHSWLVTDQISLALCILVPVTCDRRQTIQNRGELLQRAQASSTSTHALDLRASSTSIFLEQAVSSSRIEKMCTHYLHYKLFGPSSEVNFDLYKVMQASECVKTHWEIFATSTNPDVCPSWNSVNFFFVLQQQHCICLTQFNVYSFMENLHFWYIHIFWYIFDI